MQYIYSEYITSIPKPNKMFNIYQLRIGYSDIYASQYLACSCYTLIKVISIYILVRLTHGQWHCLSSAVFPKFRGILSGSTLTQLASSCLWICGDCRDLLLEEIWSLVKKIIGLFWNLSQYHSLFSNGWVEMACQAQVCCAWVDTQRITRAKGLLEPQHNRQLSPTCGSVLAPFLGH